MTIKRLERILILLALLVLALEMFTPAARADEDDLFSIVWLSDTQSVAYNDYPRAFESMGEWIMQSGAKFIIQTGDMVDNGYQPDQWNTFRKLYNQFAGVIPYIAIAGNHDLGVKLQEWDAYLALPEVQAIPNENKFAGGKAVYATFTHGGEKFIIAGAGYGAAAESTAWLNQVLSQHSDHTAIIIAHDYLKSNGELSREGRELFEAVVTQNDNVRLILCGHARGTSMRTDEIDGRTVTAMMYNYQDYSENCGQIRTLTFDTTARSIRVITYSPYTDEFYKDSTTGSADFTIENAF